MPYRKYNQKTINLSTSEFFNKIKGEIQNLISEREYDFYELEPVEVIDILLDEEKLPETSGRKDNKYYGAIKGRWVENKKQTILPLGEVWILPLDPHIKNYPVIGENVVCVNHLGRTYYTTIVNYKNNPNNNKLPGLSSTGKGSHKEIHTIYEGGTDIQRHFNVKANPGDFILQGRQGQSINLGSHQQVVSSIKMVAGHNPKNDYDINKDGASIYIQEGGSVDVENPNDKYKKYPGVGSKVVIYADEIVLTARKNIKIVSGNRTEILWKQIELKHNKGGSRFTGETKELLDNTRDKIKDEIIREVEKCIHELLLVWDKVQEDFERVSDLIERLKDIPELTQEAVDMILGAEISINAEKFKQLSDKWTAIQLELDKVSDEEIKLAAAGLPSRDPVKRVRLMLQMADIIREFANVKELFRPNIKLGKPSE